MRIFNFKKLVYSFALFTSLFILPFFAYGNPYVVTKIVSDTNSAPIQDPRLVNPWGLYVAEEGGFYVADNGTNLITAYNCDGSINSFEANALSSPTGMMYNSSKVNFIIPSTSKAAQFILSTENGTILAFNSTVDPNNAIVVANRSSFGSVYKGLTIVQNKSQFFIYATDFFNAKIDIFDTNFNYISSITDPTIPPGFAPFNVKVINQQIYVTYALQKGPDNHDDQPGPGNGFVDIFNLDGTFSTRLVSNGALNSPWGITQASQNYGQYSGALLVGNFGDGLINAYDINTGAFLGHLGDREGNPVVIDGLWALEFKGLCSYLFFTSGPNNERNGLVGLIHSVSR